MYICQARYTEEFENANKYMKMKTAAAVDGNPNTGSELISSTLAE